MSNRRRPPADPAARWAGRLLRGFARVGAVALAFTGFVLRTRTARRAGQALDARLSRLSDDLIRPGSSLDQAATRAGRWLERPAVGRTATRATAWLDRVVARWRL